MKVCVDKDRCQGHGRCGILAPDVFEVDDLGKASVLLEEVPDELAAAVREAALSCPESAITVAE
jgi:ferredoxin